MTQFYYLLLETVEGERSRFRLDKNVEFVIFQDDDFDDATNESAIEGFGRDSPRPGSPMPEKGSWLSRLRLTNSCTE